MRQEVVSSIARADAATPSPHPLRRVPRLPGRALVVLPILFGGLLSFLPQIHSLFVLWTTDPLRSIGALIPPVSLWLAVRAWSSRGWEDWKNTEALKGAAGFWGVALMVAAMGAATADTALDGQRLMLGVNYGVVGVHLIPPGVVLSAYFSGFVLQFGGWRAWRIVAFPLLLLVLVNPVPSFFTTLLDPLLQSVGARTARHFAALIGVPVSGDALKLMFSTQLGIFIAPGCDGLRGGVAMGLMALVIGYLRALRVIPLFVFAVAAVMLAYISNLLRLCAVVTYYWFALRIPSLGQYGTQADYLIGGILFFCAATMLFHLSKIGEA